MPATHPEQLIHQLVVGDAAAIAAIVEAARTSDDPMILVAAALFAPDGADLVDCRRFEARGPMSDYVKAIPTRLVVEPELGLIGAAAAYWDRVS